MKSKIIYLTIDDAPSSHMRKKIDYLIEKEIPAIFYCRGEFLANHLDQAVYAIEKGFLLGNHSYSHPYFSEITIAQAEQEILKTEELLNEAYKKANIERPCKIFRFPFLDKGREQSPQHAEQLQKLLFSFGFVKAIFSNINYVYYKDLGYPQEIDAPWTYDAREYALFNETLMQKYSLFEVRDFFAYMDRQAPELGFGLHDPTSSDIVLLHDFETTHHLFEPIIDRLIQMKVKFELPSFEVPCSLRTNDNKD